MELSVILPFVGLFLLGPFLRVFVPYVRHGLESVAESGTWASFPRMNWGYLAMFLLPALEYGVAFATVSGLPSVVMTWTLVQATAFSYTGTALGHELVKGGVAVRRIVYPLK